MLETAQLLKERQVRKIFLCSTFGLFTEGLDKFDKAYEQGLFDRLLTTNLVYQTPELLSRPYYVSCDMSKYIALIIDTLNHDLSISRLLNPVDRITRCVANYKKTRTGINPKNFKKDEIGDVSLVSSFFLFTM